MSVTWRASALADIANIVTYLRRNNPTIARKVGQQLMRAGESLELFPKRGRQGIDPTTRELVAVRPYVIVYEIDAADAAVILRVWHGAQDRR